MTSFNNIGFPMTYTNIYSCLPQILVIAFFILKFKPCAWCYKWLWCKELIQSWRMDALGRGNLRDNVGICDSQGERG